MPSAFMLKTMNTVHRSLMKVSGGKVGWTMAEMPVLELTTTGRKSGQLRSIMLTTPWMDGDKLAIVASAGGNDAHPAWYLNLDAEPTVSVRTQAGARPMIARTTSGEERADLWEQITAKYDNYAQYQTKTDREIPVVILEPAS